MANNRQSGSYPRTARKSRNFGNLLESALNGVFYRNPRFPDRWQCCVRLLELSQHRSRHVTTIEPIVRVRLNSSWYDEDIAALKDTSDMLTEPMSPVKAGARIR
jgi:hypothetical protein